MGNEAGQWIMYGVDWDDPECIHTVEEATIYINEVGFLPLFKNEIPGFSLEERTVPEYWWCDDPERDPWMWRTIIARKHDIVYGKFFDKKAGFGKDGEKGFDGAIASLMMQMYLCNCDFKKRVNKRGRAYGWDVAVYSSIEHIYGYDHVTSCYREDPQESWNRIVNHIHEIYPIATDQQIRKVLK